LKITTKEITFLYLLPQYAEIVKEEL